MRHTIRADQSKCWFAKFVDDNRVFTGGDIISQQLFDATSGQRISEFIPPEATAPGVVSAGSIDAHIGRTTGRAWTLGGSQDNRYDGIYEWDLATGESRRVHKNSAYRRFLTDRSERHLILIGGGGGNVRILDAQHGTELWSTRLGNSLESLALSPDERQLAVGDDDGQVNIWKLDLNNSDSLVTSTTPEKIALHDRQIYSVAFAPDGKSILAASRDGSARRATLATRVEPYRQLGWLTNKSDCAAIPGTNFVVATSPVAICDRSTGKLIHELSSHAHRVLTVSDDGHLIAAASPSQIEVWNRTTGERTAIFDQSRSVAKSLDFSPNGQLLAVCGNDINVKDFDQPHGCVEVFEAATGTSTRHSVPGNETSSARFCADDGLIGLCFAPNQVTSWGVPDSQIRWQTSSTGARYFRVALSPDREYLVAAQRRSLQILECATGNIRLEAPCDFTIAAIAVLNDGHSFVVGGTEGQLSVWNTATGQPMFEIANIKTKIEAIRPLDTGFLVATRQKKKGRPVLTWYEF